MVKTAERQSYTPERGDLVWLVFDPQAEHEQSGRRPAIVISPISYNSRTNLALFCPVTSKVKKYPFEVLLPEDGMVRGAILSDQIKSLDWKARKAKFIAKAPAGVLVELFGKIGALVNYV